MEDKINKLFAIFNDFKNQQLFTLALAQIVSIYNDYPACLYQILRKTNKLIYSRAQDPRLRLEHSQLAAAIIERTYRIYNNRLEQSLSTDEFPENLFHFEPVDEMPQQMQLEFVHDYDVIRNNIRLKAHQIDFAYLIQDNEVILGKDSKYLQRSQEYKKRPDDQKEEDIKSDELLRIIGLSGNFNTLNASRILAYFQGEIDFPMNMDSSSEENEQSSEDDAVGQYQNKKSVTTGTNKTTQKTKKPQLTKYCVINPFNVIYNRALFELLNHKWQDRHASALVLKSIVRQKGFINLGFSYFIKGNEKDMTLNVKQHLQEFICDREQQMDKLEQVLTRCCVVIAMDRFADYKGNQTHMIVREAACQAAISLLSDEIYKEQFWQHNKEKLNEFVDLMKDFLRVSQEKHVYEVSQSALFLIKGLLQENLEQIYDNFHEALLQAGEEDIEDEILELLADIWKEFLRLGQNDIYFNKVYQIILKQLHRQDDISFASKSIFEFLQDLFKSSTKIQCNCQKELELFKKFYFHRIVDVRHQFYKFLEIYISSNQANIKNIDDLLLQYMIVTYQNALYEENQETFETMSRILKECSKSKESRLNQFLQQCQSITCESQFSNNFRIFDGINGNLNIHYPQIFANNAHSIEQYFYRLIKTAHLLKNLDVNIEITDQIDFKNFILIYRNHLLSIDQPKLQIDNTRIFGQCFDDIDLVIQVNMQTLNVQLLNYAKIETEQEYLQIINTSNKLYLEFAMAPAHSHQLRLLYPQILQQLKLLGVLEYEMDSQSIQKLQDTILRLVEYLQKYTRWSNELILNFSIILNPQIDKFQILQDIAALHLVEKVIQDPNWCDLTPLYQKVNIQNTQMQYILSNKSQLKRKDYGRKMLIYLLLKDPNQFQWWYLYFERLFLSQLKYFPQNLNLTKNTTNNTIMIKYEELNQNLWGIGLIKNVYDYFIAQGNQNHEFNVWIQNLLNYVANVTPVIQNMVDEEATQITMDDGKNLIQFQFDVNFKKINSFNLIGQVNKLFAKLIHLIQQSGDKQVYDQTILLINGLFNSDQVIIYDILTSIIKQHPAALTSIAGYLTLKTIKKLTSNNAAIQTASSKLLGQLIPLLTIQQSIYEPIDLALINKFRKANEFQIGFGKMTAVDYQIVAGLKNPSIVRDYQWDGIRWLGFLIKYNLHAALCDDMGLGKTLQTLAVLANETHKRQTEKLVSLVIAPSTVVDHWYAETKKYISSDVLRPSIYSTNETKNSNLILISYNQMLKASQQLLDQDYYFLILDEAHILKNNRNKSSKIIRSLKAKHKIVLSGTPVQNHLLELWSLFDLLLPNYLGDEEYFKKNFSKAFHTNLFSLTDEEIIFDEQQIKTLKLLHKKVLPFIMRRTKQDVLPQLPDKIIEDYYCTLASPLQSKIYQLLENNSFSQDMESQLEKSTGEQKNRVCESILKLLQKMRQTLDHPLLIRQQKKTKKKVKTEDISEKEINKIFDGTQNPEAYTNSGKMIALKDILQQLGFNCVDDAPPQEQIQIYTNYNKVLVFSRFRAALSMIVEQLLKPQFPNLQYLVLDGTVPQSQRYPLVTKFNEDPDIRVLLLTTQVGGLGLNLCSANIVIMFDHDYNPVNDQQAMDRAHRIGQKNVVQVFRLIVKNTLEEKIMGIQRFKNAISKAIVNSDNASLKQMEQTDILSMLEQTANQQEKQDKNNNQGEEQIEKLGGTYSKILSQLQMDLIEQLNFDKEY